MQPLRQAHDMALHPRIVSVTGEFDDGTGGEQFTNDLNDAGLEQFKGSENRNLVNGPCQMAELKSAILTIRIKPSIKRKAERRAASQSRSFANYIERLIEQDAKRG